MGTLLLEGVVSEYIYVAFRAPNARRLEGRLCTGEGAHRSCPCSGSPEVFTVTGSPPPPRPSPRPPPRPPCYSLVQGYLQVMLSIRSLFMLFWVEAHAYRPSSSSSLTAGFVQTPACSSQFSQCAVRWLRVGRRPLSQATGGLLPEEVFNCLLSQADQIPPVWVASNVWPQK